MVFLNLYEYIMKKKILALCIGGLLGGACTSKQQKEMVAVDENKDDMFLLVGSYALPEEEGVKVYRFNETTGKATYVSGLKGISNPSYLTPSASGERIYVVGENDETNSTANAVAFHKEEGKLTLLNSQLTNSAAPCYINLDFSERFVTTANYTGGSITVFSLDEEGRLKPDSRLISFTGNGSDKERQSQPHLHCVEFTPDHKYLLANDLGTDQIHVFPVNGSVSDGVAGSLLDENEATHVKVEPGSGPRHICFHPNQKFAYLINELSGKVTAFSYREGQLEAIQYIAADTVGAKGSADIHLTPDGRFLYASNRLKADGIAVFAVDGEKGTLTKVGYELTGIHPRNFIITPNGRYLLVACRNSNLIQIFEINKDTGLLTDTGEKIETSQPVCLKFID